MDINNLFEMDIDNLARFLSDINNDRDTTYQSDRDENIKGTENGVEMECDENVNGIENGDKMELDENKNTNPKSKKGNNSEDDEDIMDRHEYEVEESVANFIDEDSIGRNIILASSDEEEEDELVLINRRMRKRKDDKLALGTSFYTGFEFKEAVLDYALEKARNIFQERWDKTKLSYKCG